MEVRIDREYCSSCMLCADICPELFELEESSILVRSETVPLELEEDCQEAYDQCPVEALELRW